MNPIIQKRLGVSEENIPQRNVGLPEGSRKKVIDFYYRTDIVYTSPRIKDEITVWTKTGKVKMRKYYLTMYLRELYALYKEENPTTKLGFTLFTQLRPKNVLLLKDQPLDQCKCIIHENNHKKLDALGVNNDRTIFWPAVLCNSADYNSDCWKGVCKQCCNGKAIPFPDEPEDKVVTYKEWGFNNQKRMVLNTYECAFGELKENFLDKFSVFQKHVRCKRIMHDTFERDKLDPQCHVLQVDFAMAYSCQYQDEIQAALWSRRSVNLFTAATYDTTGQERSYMIVSDTPDKGKNSICVFIHKLVEEIDFKDGEDLVIYSDGPATEFKNKFVTGKLLYMISSTLGRRVYWKYFATSHGKGVVDGIGGAAKARVREKVGSKGEDAVVVQNSTDFAGLASELLKNVKVLHISQHEVDAMLNILKPFDHVVEAKGISSCHVAQCDGHDVKMWHTSLEMNKVPTVSIHYGPNNLGKGKSIISPGTSYPKPVEVKKKKCVSDWKKNIVIGDWIVVKINGNHFPGEVLRKRGDDCEVNVMIPAGKTCWKWPHVKDCIFYEPKNIFKKINSPDMSSRAKGRSRVIFNSLY